MKNNIFLALLKASVLLVYKIFQVIRLVYGIEKIDGLVERIRCRGYGYAVHTLKL